KNLRMDCRSDHETKPVIPRPDSNSFYMLMGIPTLIARRFGYRFTRIAMPRSLTNLPDAKLYQPTFSPWLGEGDFKRHYLLGSQHSLVSLEGSYVLHTLLQQALHAKGDIWECGVYKGGTAAMFAGVLKDKNSPKKLYLFDTFEGMPETDPKRDFHTKGEFSNTSAQSVLQYVGDPGRCV